MTLKLVSTVALTAGLLAAPARRSELAQVKGVRYWAQADTTRVVIEVSTDFQYHTERLHNPDRIFFDIFRSHPQLEERHMLNRDLPDTVLKKIRVAETLPGVTRVVLDLNFPAEVTVSKLSNPYRLLVDLKEEAGPTIPAQTSVTRPPVRTPLSPTALPRAETPAPPATARADPRSRQPKATEPTTEAASKLFDPFLSGAGEQRTPEPARAARTAPPGSRLTSTSKPASEKSTPAAIPGTTTAPRTTTLEPRTTVTSRSTVEKSTAVSAAAKPDAPVDTAGASREKSPLAAITEPGKAARPTTSGGKNSLIRALGLKVTRVVLDPGHGGQDQGTVGPKGLLEKDLVLDVARRLGKLIEDRLGAEVIYTRTDDTFVPLEGRTALANEKKADLFLSIHANSSPLPRISGTETFYLNFTDSTEALDVASRENASSQKSIFELRDIIQQITQHDKAEESREFAGRIQGSLYAFTARSGVPPVRNRGIKKAPFVVLIGATMPSVLVEIGFLSNTREEANLKKHDYRQKLAEALFRGLSRYADSLSHFQMAAAKDKVGE